MRRALEPGGVCRIVVPDVAAIVGWYLAHQREPAEREAAEQRSADGADAAAPGARRGAAASSASCGSGPISTSTSGCTTRRLLALVAEAGFVDRVAARYLDSAIPRDVLAQVERADRVCDGAGVCVEARK